MQLNLVNMKNTRSITPPSPLQRAMEHHRAGRLAQAESLYKQHARNPEALHLLGLLYQQAGKLEAALASIMQAIDRAPAKAAYYFSIDSIFRALHRLPELKAVYLRLLELAPENTEARLQLGNACRDDGQLQEALGHYVAVLELAPDNADAYSALGDTLKTMGNIAEAESCYQQALQLQPNLPAVHNNLGTLYQSKEEWDVAARHFEAALALQPDAATAHYNLGVTRQKQRAFTAALECYLQAIALQPDLGSAYSNMGVTYKELGKLDEAVAAYQAAIAIRPDFPEALNNLGGALHDQKKHSEAIACFEHALHLNPQYAEAYYNMGIAYKELYRYEEAVICFQNAIHLMPEYADPYSMLAVTYSSLEDNESALAWCQRTLDMWPESAAAHYNLGVAYTNLDRKEAAMESFKQALARRADFVDAYNNLGGLYHVQGQCALAVQNFETAIALRPWYTEAHSNLAGALKDMGRLADAHASYEKAISLSPHYITAHSNLLLLLQYASGISSEHLFALHQRFAAEFEPELVPLRHPHANVADPVKRLKIGYVSPDFRRHAVAFSIEPVLARHDKSKVEVFCYYNHTIHDAFTDRIREHADHWLPCKALSDEQLAQRIRDDGIDILVDLAGHTAGNRLLTFARKPAPVQLGYLGYPATTGLNAMDYRFTDALAEPPGLTERYNVETLWRLPEIFCCYAAPAYSPAVIDHAPFEDNGYITFGCFNNYAKVSDEVIALWARILENVPTARLMLEIFALDDPGFRATVEQRFARMGIATERLILIQQDRKNQYVLYNRIDIALDPFPCNGGTTSFDTLWMGVPFITLAGKKFISRLGVTILHHNGLGELIAECDEDYIAIASALAFDGERLKTLRHGLREKTRLSPLMDIDRFTRHIEQAYRQMWSIWCTRQAAEGVQP